MKEGKTIHFLRELPAPVVVVPLVAVFIVINFYSDRPIWERLLENSLTALYAFLRGVNYGQQTANIGGNAVINTPTDPVEPNALDHIEPKVDGLDLKERE